MQGHIEEYADFTALNKLPKVALKYSYNLKIDETKGFVTLKVKNPSKSIAFFIYFDLIDSASEKPILPVYWNDNYVTLLPGEERTYTANYNLKNANKEKPVVKVKAWNVATTVINEN